MAKFEGLVGVWATTLSDAWFLEPPGTEVSAATAIEWLGESLLDTASNGEEPVPAAVPNKGAHLRRPATCPRQSYPSFSD